MQIHEAFKDAINFIRNAIHFFFLANKTSFMLHIPEGKIMTPTEYKLALISMEP